MLNYIYFVIFNTKFSVFQFFKFLNMFWVYIQYLIAYLECRTTYYADRY